MIIIEPFFQSQKYLFRTKFSIMPPRPNPTAIAVSNWLLVRVPIIPKTAEAPQNMFKTQNQIFS